MRTISARTAVYSRSACSRTRAGVIAGSRSVCRSFALNSGSPSATSSDDAATTAVARCSPSASSSATARSAAARRRGRSSATASSSGAAASAWATASRASPATPPMRFAATSACEPLHRPIRVRADDGPGLVQQGGHALEPPARGIQPDGEWREVAAEERVEPAADQVDPENRAPGLLAELGLAEPQRGELAQNRSRSIRSSAASVGGVEPLERRGPAIDERESIGTACLAQVRPAIVVAMVASPRGVVGLQGEQLVEERGDEVGERGHGHLRRCGCDRG